MNFPICIFDKDLPIDIANENEFRQFACDYKLISAAGGIVINRLNQILMIFRLGKWDFPKGKIETGEQPAEAALREVCEETGLTNPQIGSPLPSTFHTYTLQGEKVLKQTHWFAMHCDSETTLKPQWEEDISKAVWVDIQDVDALIKQSYASLYHFWNQLNPKILL